MFVWNTCCYDAFVVWESDEVKCLFAVPYEFDWFVLGKMQCWIGVKCCKFGFFLFGCNQNGTWHVDRSKGSIGGSCIE